MGRRGGWPGSQETCLRPKPTSPRGKGLAHAYISSYLPGVARGLSRARRSARRRKCDRRRAGRRSKFVSRASVGRPCCLRPKSRPRTTPVPVEGGTCSGTSAGGALYDAVHGVWHAKLASFGVEVAGHRGGRTTDVRRIELRLLGRLAEQRIRHRRRLRSAGRKRQRTSSSRASASRKDRNARARKARPTTSSPRRLLPPRFSMSANRRR